MPIYVLGPLNQRVRIPNQPLAVSITGSVGRAALALGTRGRQRLIHRDPHVAVLPQVTEPVTIGVVPLGGQPQFAFGTQVILAIGHGCPDDLDPVEVVFDPVDVGDKSSVTLATLTPLGDSIEVAAAAVADTPLGALASAARASARKVIAPGDRSTRAAVLLALDASASMQPVFADGSAAAAAEILVGAADAIGLTDVSAVFVGDDAVPVDCTSAAGLGEAVAQAAPRWSAGARWSRLPDTGARTVVCSDYAMSALRQRFPMLVVSSDPRLDACCVRIPPPRPDAQAGVQLLVDTGALDRITSSLVRALQ